MDLRKHTGAHHPQRLYGTEIHKRQHETVRADRRRAPGPGEVLTESVQTKRTVKGLSGLADLLGVSETTVKRYRGLLSPAIAQRGQSIVVDADKALQLWAGRRNF